MQGIEIEGGRAMDTKVELSIVIPVFNEVQNVVPLYQRVKSEADKLKKSYEILFVNDGSNDGTEMELRKLKQLDPAVRCIMFRNNFQKAAAYSAGFRHAEGNIIITMDGDLQDDPAEMEKFLAKLDEGYDYVTGWKYKGKGNPYRAWPSKFFNFIVKRANKLDIHDFNCPFKAFRREVIDPTEVYGELYRFLPVIAKRKGFRLAEVKVENLPRVHGVSKYGFERFLRGLFDFLTMYFLTRYYKRPLHFFGGLGFLLASLGSTVIVSLYLIKFVFDIPIRNTPFLFVLAVLSIVTGIQFFSVGLVSELMISLQKGSEEHYVIKEIL